MPSHNVPMQVGLILARLTGHQNRRSLPVVLKNATKKKAQKRVKHGGKQGAGKGGGGRVIESSLTNLPEGDKSREGKGHGGLTENISSRLCVHDSSFSSGSGCR